jgi:hypothetical protein
MNGVARLEHYRRHVIILGGLWVALIARTARVPRLDRDIAAARALGGTGTPTLVVNGLLLRHGVSALDSVAAATLGRNESADRSMET